MFLVPEQDSRQSLRPSHPKLRRTHFSQNLDVTGLSFVPPFICLYALRPQFKVASRPNNIKLFACMRRASFDLPRILLPDTLEGELDFPRFGCCRGYQARTAVEVPR